MEWVIFIGFALLVILFVAVSSTIQKQRAYEDDQMKKIKSKGYNLTKQTNAEEGIIGIDQYNKKLVLISSDIRDSKTEIFDFADIYSCELIIDDETIYKKSTLRTVGGALVGGMLLGKTGATIGGLSGSSKIKKNITKIELKIVVKDLANPTHKFCFYGNGVPKQFLNEKMEEAENWKDTISLIIDAVDKEDNKPELKEIHLN